MNFYPRDRVLEVQNVSKDYNREKIIENIDINLYEEEFVTLLGPSGIGKSTLFNVISGLQKPEEGKIFIRNEDVTGKTGVVSYMHQRDLLLPWRTVIDNSILPLEIKGMKKAEARSMVMEMLPIFGLQEDGGKYPFQLSGGMRQRVSLLRTYMFSKDIMLLDEPFGGLDAITKFKMQQYLLEIRQQIKATLLFITHDIEEAIFLSDRIYILNGKPARIVKEIKVDLDRPRIDKMVSSNKFNKIKGEILNLL